MAADLILGTAAFGRSSYAGQPPLSADTIQAIIDRAFQKGVRHVEIAYDYRLDPDDVLCHLDRPTAVIYAKSDGPVANPFLKARVIPLMHHYKGGIIPTWAQGFSCYSHDRIANGCGLIVQQDWSILNQSCWPANTGYRMARSIFLRGALAGQQDQRRLCLHAALSNADGVVIGPRSVDELDELIDLASNAHPVEYVPLALCNLGTHRITDPRTWS